MFSPHDGERVLSPRLSVIGYRLWDPRVQTETIANLSLPCMRLHTKSHLEYCPNVVNRCENLFLNVKVFESYFVLNHGWGECVQV